MLVIKILRDDLIQFHNNNPQHRDGMIPSLRNSLIQMLRERGVTIMPGVPTSMYFDPEQDSYIFQQGIFQSPAN